MQPVDGRLGWRGRSWMGLSVEPTRVAADAKMVPTSQATLKTARILLVPAAIVWSRDHQRRRGAAVQHADPPGSGLRTG